MVFRGHIVGPNGIDHFDDREWQLPKGFRAWCHVCGYEPSNKVTIIPDDNGKKHEIPGLGFKTLEDLIKHKNYFHDYRKVRVL